MEPQGERQPQREKSPIRPKRGPGSASIDRLFLYNRGDVDFADVTGFQGGAAPVRQGRELILWSWAAIFIDALILLSVCCFMTILVVKSSYFQGIGLVELMAPLGFVTWISYMVFSRTFFSATGGEWACDVRLGNPTQRRSPSYGMQVMLRCFLLVGSAGIVFPLISALFGKDLLGRMTGMSMTSLK